MLPFCLICRFFRYCGILELWQVLPQTCFVTSKMRHDIYDENICMQSSLPAAKQLRLSIFGNLEKLIIDTVEHSSLNK